MIATSLSTSICRCFWPGPSLVRLPAGGAQGGPAKGKDLLGRPCQSLPPDLVGADPHLFLDLLVEAHPLYCAGFPAAFALVRPDLRRVRGADRQGRRGNARCPALASDGDSAVTGLHRGARRPAFPAGASDGLGGLVAPDRGPRSFSRPQSSSCRERRAVHASPGLVRARSTCSFALFVVSLTPPVAQYLAPYKSAYPLSQAITRFVAGRRRALPVTACPLYGVDVYTGRRTPIVDDIGELEYGSRQLPAAERQRYFLRSDGFFALTKTQEGLYCATRDGREA